MDSARQQIVDSIKNNSNILVTVSTNPSVDELSAALGLTILLNNMDKRAAAVFSGTIPPAINFLEPDKTFENSADSLRDFIIALDKEKADHLRYKVEGDVVKIFITPYKTTLTQNDLEFSQGDYNVELVVAVGVKDQDHLDKALTAHGKILHDATVVTITAGNDTSSLGTIDWHDGAASSLCEMMVSLVDGLKTDKPLLDEQISSAFLTGIVSATDRFSNDRTSSRAMTMAAQLMAAGANQQLIAAKLEEAHDIAPGPVASPVSAKPSKQPEASQSEPEANNSELSISRSDRGSKKEQKLTDDGVSAEDTSSKQDSADTVPGEKELEAQLAESVLPTMADIEKELQQVAESAGGVSPVSVEEAAPQLPADDTAPLTAATDSDMPGFEASDVVSPTTEVAQPDLPPLPDLPAVDQSPVSIVDDRGPFTG